MSLCQEEMQFSVDSALLSELGERLVERSHIALAELAKNAYDADATKLFISLKLDPHDESGMLIEIRDNGSGMTFNEVSQYWMRIATTHKVRDDISKTFGRRKSGAKGIGRFSCRRLGTHLALQTTAKKGRAYQTTTIDFDWASFEAGTDVTEISCPGEVTKSQSGETGTKLSIRGGLPKDWMTRDWNTLKRQLARLVANRGVQRDAFAEDPGFQIYLDAPDLEDKEVVDLREELIDAGWGTLTINIDTDGKVKCSLHADELGRKSITMRDRYPELAGTSARIGVFPDVKAQFRDTSILSLGTLESILKDWGGVNVRHNGVRVYPYGEPGNDWLQIDRDRALRHGKPRYQELLSYAEKVKVGPMRALLPLLSSHSHMGDVELETTTPELFQVKASREGFVGEMGIEKLRMIVRFGIDWATILRGHYLRLILTRNAEEAKEDLESLVGDEGILREERKAIETATRLISDEAKLATEALPPDRRGDVRAKIASATKVIERVFEQSQEERQHLRIVASTSSLLLIFAHEVKSLLGDLDGQMAQLKTIERNLSKEKRPLTTRLRERIGDSKKRFSDLLKMTSLILEDSRAKSPERLELRSRAQKARDCFSLIIAGYQIDVHIEIPPTVKAGPLLEAELYALFLNGLSNAIKSVIAQGGRDKQIQIAAERVAKKTHIHVRDSGIGVQVNEAEDLFLPFTADPDGRMYDALSKKINPQDSYIIGSGSGLGLSIIKEIVTARNGEVQFIEPSPPWKTDLEVILP